MAGLSKRLRLTTPIARIYTVDMAYLRNTRDVDLIGGAHQLVYPWMPPREIWIEETLGADGRHILAHELIEVWSMLTYGDSYAVAHRGANVLEGHVRRLWSRGVRRPDRLVRELKRYCQHEPAGIIARAVCAW